MLVYRVCPYLDHANDGESRHPLYEHTPQRGSRIDHPDYYARYLGCIPGAGSPAGRQRLEERPWDFTVESGEMKTVSKPIGRSVSG